MEQTEMSFNLLHDKYNWKEIPNCPGRYVPRKSSSHIDKLTPHQVIESDRYPIQQFTSEKTKDPIQVMVFPDGSGLLTYVKSDGRYVHTLNTPSGLVRKSSALGLSLTLPQKDNV